MKISSGEVTVREFKPERDIEAVEAMENTCEVGPSGGKLTLFTHLLGDPLSRVRHSPSFFMLVAESSTCGKIVGVVRGCIKTVTCGKKMIRSPSGVKYQTPIYTKLAYLLGLRVSPSHRRMGIGLKLVQSMEDWFKSNGAEYSYIATDQENIASLHLFTVRSGYTKFRTPSILVHPVFAHSLTPRHTTNSPVMLTLSPSDAELLYRARLSTTEFFPTDIGNILHNPLSVGTFLALPSDHPFAATWPGSAAFLASPPASWAVLSVWNCKAVFRLEVRGAGKWRRGLARLTRVVDRAMPFLRIPSVPDVFRPFGMYLMYGIDGEGEGEMVRVLCRRAHNMAREAGCGVVAAEVAAEEPLRKGIPYWRRMSCDQDLWCVKRLAEGYGDGAVGDWTKAPPGKSIFVDPREF